MHSILARTSIAPAVKARFLPVRRYKHCHPGEILPVALAITTVARTEGRLEQSPLGAPQESDNNCETTRPQESGNTLRDPESGPSSKVR